MVFTDCLQARLRSDPVALHDVSIRSLTFASRSAAIGYRVRGLHGQDTSTVLIIVETIVIVRDQHLDVVTISSSGRAPIDELVRTNVIAALESQ